jgi:hypothetical protein
MMRAFQIACRPLAGPVEQEFPSPAKVQREIVHRAAVSAASPIVSTARGFFEGQFRAAADYCCGGPVYSSRTGLFSPGHTGVMRDR